MSVLVSIKIVKGVGYVKKFLKAFVKAVRAIAEYLLTLTEHISEILVLVIVVLLLK